jgi:hypothetical protein
MLSNRLHYQISYILRVISSVMNKQIAVGVIVMIALMTIGITSQVVQSQLQKGDEAVGGDRAIRQSSAVRAAPIAISGDNIYIVWPTNSTGDDEVNFRASTDGGTTFADKINLSNTTGAESQDVEIAADGNNVIVTWWERNQTAENPAAIISTDNGQTFGPILKLAANGTIGGG